MIQWHIWDLGTCCSDSGDQQLERMLVQALLKDKQFLAARIIISPILIFYLIGLTKFVREVLSLAQFCNLGIGDILGTWGLG